MHDNAREHRQRGLEVLPDPHRDALAGRIVEPGDIVEVAMVEGLEDRRKGSLDVRKVHDPAGLRPRLAGHMHVDAELMTVQPRALVPGRHVRQPVRGFEVECLENFHRIAG